MDVIHYFIDIEPYGSNSLEFCDVSHLSIGLRNRVNCWPCPQSKNRGKMCLITGISLEFLSSFILAYNEFCYEYSAEY